MIPFSTVKAITTKGDKMVSKGKKRYAFRFEEGGTEAIKLIQDLHHKGAKCIEGSDSHTANEAAEQKRVIKHYNLYRLILSSLAKRRLHYLAMIGTFY